MIAALGAGCARAPDGPSRAGFDESLPTDQSAATLGNSDIPFSSAESRAATIPAPTGLCAIKHRIEQGRTRNRSVSTNGLGLRRQ
jgi:hypothetical protein